MISPGRLDGAASLLPDIGLFPCAYVGKEAALSSRIEGTKSSLSDLLPFELGDVPGVPLDDGIEVSSYVAAISHGLKRLRGRFPLSNRWIREIHKISISDGRSRDKEPGGFRRSQDWIQGTRSGNASHVARRRDALPMPGRTADEFIRHLVQVARGVHGDRAGGSCFLQRTRHGKVAESAEVVSDNV